MFIYLVHYDVPPPFSNGGLIAVAAEDDYECLDILSEELWDTKYQHMIMPAIEKSIKLELIDPIESGILDQYID